MSLSMPRPTQGQPFRKAAFLVFAFIWAVLFCLYFPAAKAGFVVDFTGWLDQVKNQSFLDYINRTNFSVKSLYQGTQLFSWLFYKALGTNAWGWHLLFISLHAINAALLFGFIRHLLDISGVENGGAVAFSASFLFSICPHISEVIVWEPSLHYLLGLLMILSILLSVKKWFDTGYKGYCYLCLAIYFLSVFSLEYFYLTPLLVLSYIIYRNNVGIGTYKNRTTWQIVIPMLTILLLRVLLFRFLYHDWVSRTGSEVFSTGWSGFAAKPLKYIFHLIFFGRYWAEEYRQKAYAICESAKALYSFYIVFILLVGVYFWFFKKLNGRLRLAGLLLGWTALSTALVSPMWFPETMLLTMDRYAYLVLSFGFVFIAVMLGFLNRKVALSVLVVYSLINIGFTIKLNHYWQQSAILTDRLLRSFPEPGNRITLLLNLPETMNGIPMIGASNHGEYKLMHNLLHPNPIKPPVHDVASFNMTNQWNGAHVIVVNDSTVKVTLNQWGTWWWRNGQGATDFENEDYTLYMRDVGHWYDLVLKKPANSYQLLYLNDGQWKEVDMSEKVEIQD